MNGVLGMVRLLERDTPGLLRSMSLVPMTFGDLMMMGLPMAQMDAASRDLYAIDQEGRLLLVCSYKGTAGQRELRYWYEAVPEHISAGRLDPNLQPYFARIRGAASTCPATRTSAAAASSGGPSSLTTATRTVDVPVAASSSRARKAARSPRSSPR